jgi:hypothetical protein
VKCVARKLASLLREIFGQVILVISGQSRMMYRYLVAKAGGDNLFKEVNASGDRQNSSRRNHHHDRWLEMNIRGDSAGPEKMYQ